MANLLQTPAVVTEAALVRGICLESFYDFVQVFWHEVVPEAPVWNWHIRYLCDEFQKDAERVFAGKPKRHDTIINISPGSTKSTVLALWPRRGFMPGCRRPGGWRPATPNN